ncbi:MAG: type II toxin-antitoxin system RelE/ParE family toxin [Rhodospirillaceae bacterium]|nr:type II toxin-antitoxin system RelE/ParE family toxin [Rhodospirillaceae bacterium]
MARVYVSSAARDDLAEIAAYLIEHAGETVAEQLIGRLVEATSSLESNPRLGRARDEFGPDLRSLVIGDYVVFYRLIAKKSHGTEVEIARVIHGARDISTLMRSSDA